MARYDDSTIEGRIQRIARWIKNLIPDATPTGIAGIIGCAVRESSCDPENYEAKFTGAGTLKDPNTPPTAEDIFGSWDAFYALYNYQGLDVNFYTGNGTWDKHYIGMGLWQWTGARTVNLYEWCKANNKKPFSYDGQLHYAVVESHYADIFRSVATSTASAEANATEFGVNWEGNSGSVGHYVAAANQYLPVVEEELQNGDGKFTEPSTGGNSSQKPKEGGGSNSSGSQKKKGSGVHYIQNSMHWAFGGGGSGGSGSSGGSGGSSGGSGSGSESGSGSGSGGSVDSFEDPEDKKMWEETSNENPPGGDGLTDHTRHVRAFIMKKFSLTEAHGWRQDDDGTGHGHNSGMAVDFMVGFDTNVDSEKGQRIADYFQNNFDALGCYYIIWQQRFYTPGTNIYNSAGGWGQMPDRGSPTQNHMDHVHVSFAK